MVTLRRAGAADVDALLPWLADFNRLEAIDVAPDALRAALARLLADDALGRVWWIDAAAGPVGYAVVTFGFDLEYAGRDAYLTELYVVPAARGRGAGRAALAAILAALPGLDVQALHLGVRRDNAAALALYRAAGFVETPRAFLTRRIETPI